MKSIFQILLLAALLIALAMPTPAFAFDPKDFKGEHWKLGLLMPDTSGSVSLLTSSMNWVNKKNSSS